MTGPVIFRLRRTLMQGRLDPRSTQPLVQALIARLKNSRFPAVALHKLASFRKQIVQDISPGTTYIGLENIEGISGGYVPTSEKESVSSAAVFKAGDVLFPKLRPYLNKTHHANFDGICSTDFHVLKIHGALPGYVAAILRSDSVVQLTTQWMTGNTLPRLQTEDIQNLPIPLPPPDVQVKVQTLMQVASAEKNRLTDEIDQLGIETTDVLYEYLNITPPTRVVSTFQERVFICKQSQIIRRMDPYFFSLLPAAYTTAVSKGRYSLAALKDVAHLIDTGKTPPKASYVESGVAAANPIIKAGSYSGLGIDLEKVDWIEKSFLGKRADINDIFILSAAHQPEYVGKKIYLLLTAPTRETYFVGELLRIKSDLAKVDPKYLFSLLNSSIYKLLLNRHKRGQTSHLYPRDVREILIPLPTLREQKIIVKKIQQIEDEIQARHDLVKKKIAVAKAQVKKLILGD